MSFDSLLRDGLAVSMVELRDYFFRNRLGLYLRLLLLLGLRGIIFSVEVIGHEFA